MQKKKDIDYHFFLGYFKSIRSLIVTALAKGVGKTSINKTDLGKFLITEPPLAIQNNVGVVVRGVESRRSQIRVELKESEAAQAAAVEEAI